MRVKRALLRALAGRYQRCTKRENGRVLEEFTGLIGYNYSSWLLRNCGRKVLIESVVWEQVVFIGEAMKIRLRRRRVYDEDFKRVLDDYPTYLL